MAFRCRLQKLNHCGTKYVFYPKFNRCFSFLCSLSMLKLLHITGLWLHFLLPSVLCDNLLCFYSPMLEKDKTPEFVVTECPPSKVCFMADGRYGNHSVLSARGCMAKKDCSQKQKVHFKGTTYTVSYSCCDQPHCNSCLNIALEPLCLTLALVTVWVMVGDGLWIQTFWWTCSEDLLQPEPGVRLKVCSDVVNTQSEDTEVCTLVKERFLS